jgi:hypothetical protein
VASEFNSKIVTHGFGRGANWQGRSGRSYDLVSENLEHFAMGEGELYVLAKGSHVLWVGSISELVSDPLSRTRFRLALDCADRAFRLLTPGAASERLNTIWDLEGAEPSLDAQAA